jgi:hypothetical protein
MNILSRSSVRFWKTSLVFGALIVLPGQALRAQPPGTAEVAPQPAERVKKPRAAKVKLPAKQDKLVVNFEAMFGRKLTAEETTKLQKATEDRETAVRAAQQAWREQFMAITGVTEKDIRQKQRELRQRKETPAQPAAPAVNPQNAAQPAAQ